MNIIQLKVYNLLKNQRWQFENQILEMTSYYLRLFIFYSFVVLEILRESILRPDNVVIFTICFRQRMWRRRQERICWPWCSRMMAAFCNKPNIVKLPCPWSHSRHPDRSRYYNISRHSSLWRQSRLSRHHSLSRNSRLTKTPVCQDPPYCQDAYSVKTL